MKTYSAVTTFPPGFTATPLTADLADQWARLHAIISAEDQGRWTPTPTELVEMLEPTSVFDPQRHTWSVWSGQDMVAFAVVGVSEAARFNGVRQVHIEAGVHPQWRGRGLGSALLQLTETRGQTVANALPQAPLVFSASAPATAPAAGALLHDHGYAPARYWFDMTHDLRGEFTADPRTQGFSTDLSEQLRLAHNDAFRTHWGSSPITPEHWGKLMRSAGLRPDLSRIVVEDGDVLAYALVSSTVPGEAYFDLIGVRGSAQGRGLGKAVLTSALAAIQAEGTFTEAGLDVDAENPSGAGQLYTARGFVNVAKKVTWEKPDTGR